MASITSPLKYRGVFDYPNNQSANLLGSINLRSHYAYDSVAGELSREIESVSAPDSHGSTAPPTSDHVLKFMGWVGRGKHTRYNGKPSTLSVLDQKAAWMSEWLRKGRYAAGK
jgi:hypothetical protein